MAYFKKTMEPPKKKTEILLYEVFFSNYLNIV